MREFMSVPLRQKAYQPFGDLVLTFPAMEATDYRRDLDLDTGIASVSFTSGGRRYRRTVFVSHPAQAIILRLTAEPAGPIEVRDR